MKLIYRIVLRLSAVLIPLMALWGMLFFLMTVDEIHDEADDALDDYAELIIIRMLAGRELPEKGYYEDMDQLENGVGMLRLLLSQAELAAEDDRERRNRTGPYSLDHLSGQRRQLL